MKYEFNIENTLLVKAYREKVKHVEANKWYMSERAGKDVGWERALLDFILNKKKYLKD